MGTPERVTAAQFREALAHFATGVSVVTAAAPDGPHGVTVNAFASLSIDPPLVLICIERNRYSHAVLESSGAFAVNILAAGQEPLSRFFSSNNRPEGPRAFEGIPHRPGRCSLPLLEGCLAYLECRITARYPGGDHTIFVAEVASAEVHPGRKPLVYYDRAYHTLDHVPGPDP
jgi:flavin reductase (DIM6/NTAB) family NADH-FMN oxidoreductase RutF